MSAAEQIALFAVFGNACARAQSYPIYSVKITTPPHVRSPRLVWKMNVVTAIRTMSARRATASAPPIFRNVAGNRLETIIIATVTMPVMRTAVWMSLTL